MQDEEAHRLNYQQQIEELMSKVKRMEEALRTTTTDYIIARRDKQAAEVRAAAAMEGREKDRAAAASKACLPSHRIAVLVWVARARLLCLLS
jgi:hypothetical protein